jgi:hypothetical protein
MTTTMVALTRTTRAAAEAVPVVAEAVEVAAIRPAVPAETATTLIQAKTVETAAVIDHRNGEG